MNFSELERDNRIIIYATLVASSLLIIIRRYLIQLEGVFVTSCITSNASDCASVMHAMWP